MKINDEDKCIYKMKYDKYDKCVLLNMDCYNHTQHCYKYETKREFDNKYMICLTKKIKYENERKKLYDEITKIEIERDRINDKLREIEKLIEKIIREELL